MVTFGGKIERFSTAITLLFDSLYIHISNPSVPIQQYYFTNSSLVPKYLKIFLLITIPQLKTSKISYQYPVTKAPEFRVGNVVMNGKGAPFDAFVYLETSPTSKILIAMQMKLADHDYEEIVLICLILGRCDREMFGRDKARTTAILWRCDIWSIE